MTISHRFVLYVFILFFVSCSRLYHGSWNQPYFDENVQPDKLGKNVSSWEDGARIPEDEFSVEWWYIDAKLEDKSIIVAYFYKVHNITNQYFIGFNYTSPDGIDTFKLKRFKKNDVSFSTDSCNVQFGKNYFRGNLNKYSVYLDPEDFEGFGIDLNLNSTIPPYRPQDGILKAGDDYFAWLAAVPNGKVTGNYTLNYKDNFQASGSGYHDHNWGNTYLWRLFSGWTWFRGEAGPYTVIGAELNVVNNRGGFDVPILYVADENGEIVNEFGNKTLMTMKSDLITDLYNKKNEPQFSTFTIGTSDNVNVRISKKSLLENIDIFERAGLLSLPMKLSFSPFGIDPYYTRFSSNFNLRLSDGTTYEGTGVMEIMDLH